MTSTAAHTPPTEAPSASGLATTLQFCLGLAIVLAVLGAGLRRLRLAVDWNEAKLEEVLQLEPQGFDVLYLGNSLTLHAASPRTLDEALGTRSYNAAVGGASLAESALMLRHLDRRGFRWRLTVVGVYVNSLAAGTILRPSFRLAMHPDDRAAFEGFRASLGEARPWARQLADHLDLFHHRTALYFALRRLRDEVPQHALVQGHLEIGFHRPPPSQVAPHDSILGRKEVGFLVDTCRQLGTPLMLVEFPNHPVWHDSTRGREATLAMLREVAGPAVPVVSLAELGPKLAPEDWMNLNHLSTSGAIRVSRALAPHVQAALAATASGSAR